MENTMTAVAQESMPPERGTKYPACLLRLREVSDTIKIRQLAVTDLR